MRNHLDARLARALSIPPIAFSRFASTRLKKPEEARSRVGGASVLVLAAVAMLGTQASIAGATCVEWPVANGGSGHCYSAVVDHDATWHQAATAAAAQGGHLVTITSPEEQAFVENLLIDSAAPTGAYWIDLVETATEGVYVWGTGEPLGYTHWYSGEPTNGWGGEDRVHIAWTASPEDYPIGFARRGYWNDLRAEGWNGNPCFCLDLDRGGYVVEVPCSGDASCDDGDPCTQDQCSEGSCGHGVMPMPSCTNDTPGKAVLTVHNDTNPPKRMVQFKWMKGSFPGTEFGDPMAETDYTLCVYGAEGAVVGLTASAGTMNCGARPCWSVKGSPTTAIKYKDGAKPPVSDGVKVVVGKADTTGKGKLQVKAQGGTVPPITLGAALAYPVIAQVVTTDMACWEANFTATDEKKNDGSTFKATYKAP